MVDLDSIAMDTTNKDGGKFYIAVQMGSVRPNNEKSKVNKAHNRLCSYELWRWIILCFIRVFLAWNETEANPDHCLQCLSYGTACI